MSEESIQIFARVRPCFDSSSDCDMISVDELDPNILRYSLPADAVFSNSQHLKYKFKKVFWKGSKQDEVYRDVALPLLDHALQGYNSTLFAYGQTGSGKTFTITGDGTRERSGMIPRAIKTIYDRKKLKEFRDLSVKISYLEIYNNVAYDLLTAGENFDFRKLDDLRRVTFVDNGKKTIPKSLLQEPAESYEKAHKLFWTGECVRQKAATINNEHSSRSHTIFTFIFENRVENKVIRSQINFVDLAGSEKYRTLDGELDQRKKEAIAINTSLHYLQQVIIGIVEKRPHIPFRDSILTRFLKDSLVGNCKTSMIATLSTNKDHINESISTCKFAESVSEITTKAIVNEVEITPREENKLLRAEIARLREELSMAKKISNTLRSVPRTGSFTAPNSGPVLTDLQSKVISFVKGDTNSLDITDPSEVQICFLYMRELINIGTLREKDLQQELDTKKRATQTLVTLVQNGGPGEANINTSLAYYGFSNFDKNYSVAQELRETFNSRISHRMELLKSAMELRPKRDSLQEKIDILERDKYNLMSTDNMNPKIEEIKASITKLEGELRMVICEYESICNDIQVVNSELEALNRKYIDHRNKVESEFRNFWENTILRYSTSTKDQDNRMITPKASKAKYSTLRPFTPTKTVDHVSPL